MHSGHMGCHKMNEYMHHGSPRKRRKREREESLFKEIMAKNFINHGRDMDI